MPSSSSAIHSRPTKPRLFPKPTNFNLAWILHSSPTFSQYHLQSLPAPMAPRVDYLRLTILLLLLFRHSVASDSLQLHGLQHTSPSPSPGVCSNLCSLIQWCHLPSHPLSSPSPPAFKLSWHQGLFQWVSSSHQVAQVLEFQSFSISPSSEYSGLISFRMDWFDLSVQGTLKSLLQHHNSKASILRCSAFFMVQLSHLYMTTGKTIALSRWTFGWKSNVSAF